MHGQQNVKKKLFCCRFQITIFKVTDCPKLPFLCCKNVTCIVQSSDGEGRGGNTWRGNGRNRTSRDVFGSDTSYCDCHCQQKVSDMKRQLPLSN